MRTVETSVAPLQPVDEAILLSAVDLSRVELRLRRRTLSDQHQSDDQFNANTGTRAALLSLLGIDHRRIHQPRCDYCPEFVVRTLGHLVD